MALFPADLLLALPWGHHAELMAQVKDLATRHWSMQAAVQYSWSRSVLLAQIESAAHRRIGRSTTNFASRLLPPDSDLVQQTLKDPYIFDFLTLADGFQERELETALVAHLETFHYHLDLGGQDFDIHLLFCHLKLRYFVVIDLKRSDFRSEYAGKMNFCCNVVDDRLRHPSGPRC